MIKIPASIAALPVLALTLACGAEAGSGEVAASLTAAQTIVLQPVGDSGVSATLTISPANGAGGEAADPGGLLEAALAAEGLDPLFVYPVHLRDGSCGSDRGVLAQLVSLTADAEGRASSTTPLETGSLAGARSLFAQISGPGGRPVACGEL